MKKKPEQTIFTGDYNLLTDLQKKAVKASRKYKSILQMAIEQDEQQQNKEKENKK